MSGRLLAVCTVAAVRADAGRVGRTAIDKQPRTDAVAVDVAGLAGDSVCDTTNHGGRDQAVYAYAVEEARRWSDELGEPVAPGSFGENLVVEGLAVSDAVIGQRWQVGAECVLEVTLPRVPCQTFARWVTEEHGDQPRWVRRFTERADTGAYLRVVVPGAVRAGDTVEVVRTPAHGATIRALFTGSDPDALRRLLADGEDVPAKAVAVAEQAVARADRPPGEAQ